MAYVYRRGAGAKRRKMHLATYDRFGNLNGTFCGTTYPLNTSINVPLGLKVCLKCRQALSKEPHP